jgi:hypothetical protein
VSSIAGPSVASISSAAARCEDHQGESQGDVCQKGGSGSESALHVVDPSTGQWLWHGWATETIVERLDENEEIREAVPLIPSKFPHAS